MRSTKLFALALAGSAITVAGPAHAQGIPVHDVSGLLQQVEQVRQGVSMLKSGADQLKQAQDLYRDLNKATDIGRLASSLKSDALRGMNVSSGSIGGYTSGDLNVVGGLRGKANEAYQSIMGQLPTNATSQTRAAYEQHAREAAVTAGLASNVGSSVSTRRDGLEELRARLGTATSASERADMSARLQLEQAQMMNDNLALQSVELQRRAKAEADYQGYIGQEQQQTAHLKTQMGID